MENESGDKVDLYIPRKCSSSSRLISSKDHASTQIEFVDVDPVTGRMTNQPPKRYAICGALRRMGEADDCLNRLAMKDNMLPKNFSA